MGSSEQARSNSAGAQIEFGSTTVAKDDDEDVRNGPSTLMFVAVSGLLAMCVTAMAFVAKHHEPLTGA